MYRIRTVSTTQKKEFSRGEWQANSSLVSIILWKRNIKINMT